ncbi:hypothetical protein BDR26DRAFT_897749 [Obelidium mucronatum]|nr:hypothetical protein BDR26DRAFT_897749 [Obelidium mucronatum]
MSRTQHFTVGYFSTSLDSSTCPVRWLECLRAEYGVTYIGLFEENLISYFTSAYRIKFEQTYKLKDSVKKEFLARVEVFKNQYDLVQDSTEFLVKPVFKVATQELARGIDGSKSYCSENAFTFTDNGNPAAGTAYNYSPKVNSEEDESDGSLSEVEIIRDSFSHKRSRSSLTRITRMPYFYAKYTSLLEQQSLNKCETTTQLARHAFDLTKWFCFCSEYLSVLGIFLEVEKKFEKGLIPISFAIDAVRFVLSEDKKLEGIMDKIEKLQRLSRVTNSTPCLVDRVTAMFSKAQPGVYLKSSIVIFALTAVHLYRSVPRRGPGSTTSEAFVKTQLWAPVLSYSFQLGGANFVPIWEFEHLISGNAGKGSGKSDFAAATLNARNVPIPFFIVEFEVGGFAEHKDYLVCVSEGVYEMAQLIGKLNITLLELGKIKFYLGFANNTTITFDVLSPRFDADNSMIFYHQQLDVASFDLSNSEDNSISETLELLCFINTKVIPAGKTIQSLINLQSGPTSLGQYLPTLPVCAEKSSLNTTMFTPLSKRVKVNSCN